MTGESQNSHQDDVISLTNKYMKGMQSGKSNESIKSGQQSAFDLQPPQIAAIQFA